MAETPALRLLDPLLALDHVQLHHQADQRCYGPRICLNRRYHGRRHGTDSHRDYVQTATAVATATAVVTTTATVFVIVFVAAVATAAAAAHGM